MLSSPASRRGGVWRGIHVIFVAILCISIILSCFGAATAQPTVNAGFGRNRDYNTLRDSVRYDEALTGRYTWDIWMGGESATPAAIVVLTKHAISDFGGGGKAKPNSTTQEDSSYRYRWDVPDVSKVSGGVFLGSDLEVTFQPGFDSERTLSPVVLDDQVTVQTLQVKVTAHEDGFVSLTVHVYLEETDETSAVLVPGSDQPRLGGQDVLGSTHDLSWNVESPVNGKEYGFSLQLRIENRLYPNKVLYKPGVMVMVSEPGRSDRLTGLTVTAEDEILGKIGFSTPSASRWQIDERSNRRVHYEQESTTAEPTVYANVGRNRDYNTLRDSVRYDESLTGQYTWDIWMGGESATPAAIVVLTKHAITNFGGSSFQPKPNSTTREDSAHRYRWDLSDVSNKRPGIFLGSDLEAAFQPGFDSERTLSPVVLDDQVTVQTLQVKVTPREGGFANFEVHVSWEEAKEASAVLVPGSDQPRLDQQNVWGSWHDMSWNVGKSPVNGKEYQFSLQLRIENKLYPNRVVFKPKVMTSFHEPGKSERLTESTVTVQDDILGEIGFSTPSTSMWQIDHGLTRRVSLEGESSVWGGVGDYTTCKSLDQDGNPVERSRDFLAVDDGVTVWVNLHDLRTSVDVKFEWYAPNGSLYREHSVTTPAPPEGEEGWSYAVHDSIEVKGKQPSRMLGDWSVKIFVDGAEPIVTGFTVTAAPSWTAAYGGYSILVAAIAAVVIVSFVLFWRRRTRRARVGVEPVAVPPAAKAYCIFCAAPMEPEHEFCMQCGRRQIRIEPPR